nr:hypothetical protein DM860_015277 [Ipomoea batatas]
MMFRVILLLFVSCGLRPGGMGDGEKMDLERLNGDLNTTMAKKNRIAELDQKIIEENVEEGLGGSSIQPPLAAVAISAAFVLVVVVCYLRFRRRI